MVSKLVENLDEEVWRKFTGICKNKGVFVGNELTRILKTYIQEK